MRVSREVASQIQREACQLSDVCYFLCCALSNFLLAARRNKHQSVQIQASRKERSWKLLVRGKARQKRAGKSEAEQCALCAGYSSSRPYYGLP